ncbi:MAG: Holliday junction branch migration protein RuvA [Kiloniellales bacterium]|nr:Holliday junction branch migration protein RuvA [Kiloniellales bacterium]
MIGKLTGRLDDSSDDWAIVDVSGVGYLVFASRRTLGRLEGRGEVFSLFIETHVREDHIHLYGFIDQSERDWFRLLCTVQGVGAKMALAVLSVLGPEQLVQVIAAQDKQALTRANGVGPKVAGRILSELKDKAGKAVFGSMVVIEGGKREAGLSGVSEDAVSALVNLGYRRAEAFGAVARVAGQLGDEATVERLITAGLKELAS